MFMAIDDMEWNIVHCSKYISLWQKGICSLLLKSRMTFNDWSSIEHERDCTHENECVDHQGQT